MYNYSIIIPHYNVPQLLQRCLDSIPDRPDVEVIVVDDCSDPQRVNKAAFPGLARPNTAVIFSDGTKGKGPGFARNEGLKHATGKWIIFADADDYMLPSLSQLMNTYVDAPEDVLYFRCAKEEADGSFIDSYDYMDNAIDLALVGNEDELLYYTPCPWAKFIKRSYIEFHHITFQQITGGDDYLFSIDIAQHTTKRRYIQSAFYCVVMAPDSLTRTTDWHRFYNFSIGSCSAYKALLPLRKEQQASAWVRKWYILLYEANPWQALRLFSLMQRTIGWKLSLVNLKKGFIKRHSSKK